jgi:hypothetical protein
LRIKSFLENILVIQKVFDENGVLSHNRIPDPITCELNRLKYEVKDLPTHDFAGENGEDTYIPSFIPVKAYDCTIEFKYTGELDSCYTNIYLGFIKYLQGAAPVSDDYDSITEGGFKIYDRHNGIGRQKVYMKSFDPDELIHMTDDDHLTFKLPFRFTDPTTDITLTDPNAKVTL